jgi:hypothetical protein
VKEQILATFLGDKAKTTVSQSSNGTLSQRTDPLARAGRRQKAESIPKPSTSPSLA